MSWVVLTALVLGTGLALCVALARRAERGRTRTALETRERLREAGADEAALRLPVIDLSRCLGCATCVDACPEREVLGIAHGQALVLNGARCRGIRACERECPVGAISLRVPDADERDDLPALTPDLEAVGNPGLYLAGEVTAQALVRTAVEHGRAVAARVARRKAERLAPSLVLGGVRVELEAPAAVGAPDDLASCAPGVVDAPAPDPDAPLDLVVVGAGPAGLACALEARRLGLSFLLLEQEAEVGGTVARYPRGKLVLTQPFELPLVGRFQARTYGKEELVDVWRAAVADHELPLRTGVTLEGVERRTAVDDDPEFEVRTSAGSVRAASVCLAIGRRGVPRRLGVPGEDLPKVAYGLVDAASHGGRRVLVVGGGDSAVEAALGLAEQPGCAVTLAYRGRDFFRIGPRSQERLRQATQLGRLDLRTDTVVTAIEPERVHLARTDGTPLGPLPNDEILVLAGGTPARAVLEASQVSCDPGLRQQDDPVEERGTGLGKALGAAFAFSLATLVFALVYGDYYLAPRHERAALPHHDLLRPGHGTGLALGIGATLAVVVNLLYLARRSPRVRLFFGSLERWMTVHVASGVAAVLLALLHGGMTPRDTVGGHAWWALVVLLGTGAVGRYLYAWVPRAANGRELALDEVRTRLDPLEEARDTRHRAFRLLVRERVLGLVDEERWRGGLAGRLVSLVRGQRSLRRVLAELSERGRSEGVPADEMRETLDLARTAHRHATQAAHAEELRAVLSTWRWAHRWMAALMVLLVLAHIAYALLYTESLGGVR